MKKLLGTLLAASLFTPIAFAQTDDETIENSMEIVALAGTLKDVDSEDLESQGLYNEIANLKETTVYHQDSFTFRLFDINHNGKIDVGFELNNLVRAAKVAKLVLTPICKLAMKQFKYLYTAENPLIPINPFLLVERCQYLGVID